MKTPRQILLEHHQAAVPRLDHLRAKVLESLGPHSQSAPPEPENTGLWGLVWNQLFAPVRAAWCALASLALLALWLQNAAPLDTTTSRPSTHATAASPIEAARERVQLLAEILETHSPSALPTEQPALKAPSPTPSPTNPRSAISRNIWAA